MRRVSAFLLGVVFLLASMQSANAQTPEPKTVVRAVLFYSPTCPHCHLVITQTLPPLFEKYGERLEMVGIDILQEEGYRLFLLALQKFGLTEGGVPFLVIGEVYLMGSKEIPEKFPGLVEEYLARGGVDWPDLPGLAEVIAAAQAASPQPTFTPAPVSSPSFSSSAPTSVAPMPTETPSTLRIEQPSLSLSERFGQDPIGNTLAILTLVGMLIALGVGVFLAFFSRAAPPAWLGWTIPVLAFLGLLVSGYLSYVEVTGTEAVCGPVGDCNAVQQSPYARLFGVVPIGVLGLVGYFFILGLWLVARVGRERPVEVWATLLQMALTVLGVLFSIYLTFLEPFVIGATCAWCLTSAILMTLLMLAAVWTGRPILQRRWADHKEKRTLSV